MTTYADLPIELRSKIIDALVEDLNHSSTDAALRKHLSILRLAARDLNALATPKLFHTLRLEFPGPGAAEQTQVEAVRLFTEVITTLATGTFVSASVRFTTSVFHYTKKLEFTMGDLLQLDLLRRKAMEMIVQQHLAHAAAALRNLETARCCFLRPFPQDAVAGFIGVLGTLPAFRHLQLAIREDLIKSPSIFRALSNLQTLNIRIIGRGALPGGVPPEIASLIVRSPNLQHLSVGAHSYFRAPSVMLYEIFPSSDHPEPLRLKRLDLEGLYITPDDIQANIRHFGKLERLSIMNNSWAERPGVAYGNIWSTLHRNYVHLHALSTDAIGCPGFVEYLTSFTGLRELVIISRHLLDTHDNELVNAVIAHHHETLEILDLGDWISWTSCLWIYPSVERSIIDIQHAEITKCENLRELAVYYKLRTLNIEFDNRDLFTSWLNTAMGLRELVRLRLKFIATPWTLDRGREKPSLDFGSKVIREFAEKFKPHFEIIHTVGEGENYQG